MLCFGFFGFMVCFIRFFLEARAPLLNDHVRETLESQPSSHHFIRKTFLEHVDVSRLEDLICWERPELINWEMVSSTLFFAKAHTCEAHYLLFQSTWTCHQQPELHWIINIDKAGATKAWRSEERTTDAPVCMMMDLRLPAGSRRSLVTQDTSCKWTALPSCGFNESSEGTLRAVPFQ